MNPVDVAVYTGVAAIPILYSYWTTRATRKRVRLIHEHKVDGEAYDRAQRINDLIVKGLRDEVIRLQTELIEMRRQQHESHIRGEGLERHIAALERTVSRMRTLLRTNGIEIPGGA